MPQRLAAADSWLAQESASHWVIQLVLANGIETDQLIEFIREIELAVGAGRIHAYSLNINGVQKVSVVYGSFADREAAQKALADLPPRASRFKPYLRSIQLIRSEAERGKKPITRG